MKTNLAMKAIGAGMFLALSACSAPGSAVGGVTSASSSSVNQNSLVGKVSLSVSDSSSKMIYSDNVSGSSLVLKAGQNYTVNLSVNQAPAGTSASFVCSLVSSSSGGSMTYNLSVGANNFSVPSQGDYSCKLTTSAPGYAAVSKSYLADVTCASPSFTQASLNANGIAVSSGSGQNMYSYSAASVISGANGMAPYTCAWDVTGTGIQDSTFSSCSSAVSAYDNYVGTRNIGLLVKDACNITYAVSKSVNLAYVEPSKPGNNFIFGQVLGASGAAKGDSRIDGVNYLATNINGNNIVQPNYSKGVFVITAQQNYGMPSSVNFGVQIKVKGITDTINVASGSGTVNASAAMISSLTYTTDQNGDQSPAVSLTSTSCTLSNQGAKVVFVTGQPCTAGKTGDNNSATVEVWGHYSCTNLSNSSSNASIQGDFDGYAAMVDNCSGGGGGGGGVSPINL